MTDEEIASEIETCRRYLMDSDLDEDAKDSLRALLRAARSGDERGISVLLACSEVRNRVREHRRMVEIAGTAAAAAVEAHAKTCRETRPMAYQSPALAAFRAWTDQASRWFRVALVAMAIAGIFGRLPDLFAFVRSLLPSVPPISVTDASR